MSAEFFWAILLVVALIAGPFAALRAASSYRIRMTAAQKKRQALLEEQEKAAEARGDKPGFW
jgi:hypothetical protein